MKQLRVLGSVGWNLYALLSPLYRRSWSSMRALEYGDRYPLFCVGSVKRLGKIVLVGMITYFIRFIGLVYYHCFLRVFYYFLWKETNIEACVQGRLFFPCSPLLIFLLFFPRSPCPCRGALYFLFY